MYSEIRLPQALREEPTSNVMGMVVNSDNYTIKSENSVMFTNV